MTAHTAASPRPGFCWFAEFRRPGDPPLPLPQDELLRLTATLADTPGLDRALCHGAIVAEDPFIEDSPPLWQVLQCYFDAEDDLAAAIAADGPLAALADPGTYPTLAAADARHQPMTVHRLLAPDPLPPLPACCTYLVAYEGPAEDPAAWRQHYRSSHGALMTRLPAVREVEIYEPLACPTGLSWPRASHMQRNKVVFDSPQALTGALHSPVRSRMREDFRRFPPFSGRVTHHPLHTRLLHRGT